MNLHSKTSAKIYNFRLFGTINQYERFTKNIISNLCVKAIKGLPLELKQDCRFSFIDINDIIPIIDYALTHELKYHDYNLAMERSYLLSEVADVIMKLSGRYDGISFLSEGLNLEYTASNQRIIEELSIELTPIEIAVKRVYNYYDSIKDTIDVAEIDARWK